METLKDKQIELDGMQDNAISLELDILQVREQIDYEQDEIHITFLSDHLFELQYQLDRTNADIYLLRQEIKLLENQEKHCHLLESDKQFDIMVA